MLFKIKKQYEFDKLINDKTKTIANYHYVLKKIPNPNVNEVKYALIVSKKVGKAHERHIVRRKIKEVIRLNQDSFVKGNIYLLIARKSLLNSKYKEYEKSFKHILKLSNQKENKNGK